MTFEYPGKPGLPPIPPPPPGPLPPGTHEFDAAGSLDFFDLGLLSSYPHDPRQPSYYRIRKFKGRDDVVELTLRITDLRGGLDRTWGDLPECYDRTNFSTADSSGFRALILPPALTESSDSTYTITPPGSHACFIFNTLAVGAGAEADHSLFSFGTSLSARTYSPGSAITGLWPIVIGGVTTANQLAVCKAGGVIEVLSDLASTPTSTGSMHANTNPAWGVLLTGLPHTDGAGFYILIYANGNIYTLSTADAIGTAPTVATAGVPNGGCALGLQKLPGRPKRAYWIWPNQNTTTGMFTGSGTTEATRGQVYSTALDGTDPQILEFPELPFILNAIVYGDGIAATDGTQWIWNRGDAGRQNLLWTLDRDVGANIASVIKTFQAWVVGNRLVVDETTQSLTSGGLNNGPHTQLVAYDPILGTWQPVGGFTTHASGGGGSTVAARFAGTSGYNPSSKFACYFGAVTGGSTRETNIQMIPDFRRANYGGPKQLTSVTYATSAIWYSPNFEVPGLEGWAKVPVEITFAGDLFNVGSDATVAVAVGGAFAHAGNGTGTYTGGVSRTFAATSRRLAQIAPIRGAGACSTIQVGVTLTRGSASSTKTPQALPLILRFLCWAPNTMSYDMAPAWLEGS